MSQVRGGNVSSHGGKAGPPISPDEEALRRALLSDDGEPLAALRAVFDRIEQESRREPPELGELRQLLFGSDLQRLASLQAKFDNPSRFADAISQVLAEAVALRGQRDQTLRTALAPTIEEALRLSIRKNPKVLADALFPVIGPAIRKAIAAAFAGMVESLNQTLDHSFSIQGLKWRLEARAAGRPFAEVVLSRTLVYQVEQVFLVHKKTGLALCHAARRPDDARDPDLVSGMLTAIQDFVRDSFSAQEDEELEAMRVGDCTVRIEQGPHALLAAVIRGNPPSELHAIFLDALESVHLECGRELETFQGDASPFDVCRPTLELCLHAKYGAGAAKSFRPVIIFTVLATLTLLLPLGTWAFLSAREYSRWTHYLARLRAEPGIVVTAAEQIDGRYVIIGLRDPLAAEPLTIARSFAFDAARLECRWEPYFSLTPPLVIERARRLLQPPETVALTLNGDALRATGTAPRRWIQTAAQLEFAIPGVARFDADNVLAQERIAFSHVKQKIESQSVRFPLGGDMPEVGQENILTTLQRDIDDLRSAARSDGVRAALRIIGCTDAVGTLSLNRRLGDSRAERVRAALQTASDDTLLIQTVGVARADSETTLDLAAAGRREVIFRVDILETR